MIKKSSSLFYSLPIIALLYCCSPFLHAQSKAPHAKKKASHSLYYKNSLLDVNEVMAYIISVGIKHPDIVIRQAVYESASFRYRPLMVKNNIFGFRQHRSYLRYKSWKSCVDYYKNWQDKRYTNDNEDYYNFLIRIKYATSKVYIAHLKAVKLNLKR